MKKLVELFHKINGKELIVQYMRAHVFLFFCIQVIVQGLSRKSLEIVRLSVSNKILCKLRKKYNRFVVEYKNNHINDTKCEKGNRVWICWLQGIENAPNIVKECYLSLVENIKNREIIVLTEENYHDYVQFPEYIQNLIDDGVISKTHMSDLLRVELLIQYGGTWIDATVYCSGNDYQEYMFDSELFMFQTLKPGSDGASTRISSWFMTAYSNNPILLLTRALIYEYWKENKYQVDYFLLHDFLEIAIENYPVEWNKVVPFSNSIPHILLLRMFEEYDENIWNNIKKMTSFHKLSYKFDDENFIRKNTYYSRIIRKEEKAL